MKIFGLVLVVLMMLVPASQAQAPALQPAPLPAAAAVPAGQTQQSAQDEMMKTPEMRQLLTQRELLYTKLQGITEFQLWLETEKSINQYVRNWQNAANVRAAEQSRQQTPRHPGQAPAVTPPKK